MRAQQARRCRERSRRDDLWDVASGHPEPPDPSGMARPPCPVPCQRCPTLAAIQQSPGSGTAQAPVLLQWCQALLPLSAALWLGSRAEGGCEGVKDSLQARNA